MEDLIEMPGGHLKIRPKSHIRGENNSLLHESRKWEKSFGSSGFGKRRSEEFLKQDLGQANEEPKSVQGTEDVNNKQAGYKTLAFHSEERPQEQPVSNSYPEPSLRGDLSVRNQPEPGRYKSSNQLPKHFR